MLACCDSCMGLQLTHAEYSPAYAMDADTRMSASIHILRRVRCLTIACARRMLWMKESCVS